MNMHDRRSKKFGDVDESIRRARCEGDQNLGRNLVVSAKRMYSFGFSNPTMKRIIAGHRITRRQV